MSALPEQDLGFLAAGRAVRKQLTEYTAGCPEAVPWVRGREPAWPGKTGCLPTTNSHSGTCSGETTARQDSADWRRGLGSGSGGSVLLSQLVRAARPRAFGQRAKCWARSRGWMLAG